MNGSRFLYVTYIRITPDKLWQALTTPEFTRAYWFGSWQDCAWQKHATWKLMLPDGKVGDTGEVIEIEPGRKLVLTWRNEFRPELREEGYSRATFEIETVGDTVKLSVVHEIDVPQSKLIDAVSGGWPAVLSSLKSYLETGTALERTNTRPKTCPNA